jgi:hypothetical protein
MLNPNGLIASEIGSAIRNVGVFQVFEPNRRKELMAWPA